MDKGTRSYNPVIIFSIEMLFFLLSVPFIPHAHADNTNEIIQALHDPNEACNAAKKLAEIDAAQAVDPLVEMITQNKDRRLRRCAVEVLAKTGEPRTFDLLIALLADKSLIVASRAAEALGYLKDRRAVKPLIQALTAGTIPCPAAEALGWIKDPTSFEPLIAALKHESRSVRGCAAQGLGMIGDSRACQPLIDVFANDSDPFTQDCARRAFEMIGCAHGEYARTNGNKDGLCDTGQRMIEFISSHMTKYDDWQKFFRSPEWEKYVSAFMSEQEPLSASNPEAGQKIFELFALISDWADSASSLQELKHSSDKQQKKAFWTTAVERVKDKEARLKLFCPALKLPDYTE